jgi:hypothetical protein
MVGDLEVIQKTTIRISTETSACGNWPRLLPVDGSRETNPITRAALLSKLTYCRSCTISQARFDKPAILLAAFDCSPAPVPIFRKVPPTCQSAALSLHFDSSMQRQMREEYFRGELEL